MTPEDLVALQGKWVEVETPECRYQGRLVQVSGMGIALQTHFGWVEISLDRVVRVREEAFPEG